MNAYLDMSITYDNLIYRDCVMRDKGDILNIKGEEYVVLNQYWIGGYDYNVEVCPVALKGQFVN
jgi:hypothetical protein